MAGPAVSAIADALIHSSWQATLVAVCVALASRGWEPRIRYSMHIGGIGFCMLWFAATAWLSPDAGVGAATAARWPEYLVLGWACGAGAFAVRMGAGVWLTARWRAAAMPAPASWQSRLDALSKRLGADPVELRSSERIDQPVTLGWWRPVILVPAALWTQFPAAYLEALLTHELAHVRRRDYLVNLFQSVAEAVFFYHPAIWWMSHQARVLREYACDDLAVSALAGPPVSYARALAELEVARTPRIAQASQGGSLMKRLQRLVDPMTRTRPRLLVTIASFAVVIAIACAGVEADPPETPPWLPPTVSAWWPDIVEASDRHGVDPELLAIMTLVESGGDERAESRTGALGLMQVMPATGAAIAQQRGLDEFDLRDPETSLDFGAWYLAQQLDTFGDLNDAVSAYNGGPNAVRRQAFSEETVAYRSLVTSLRTDPLPALEAWRARVRMRWQDRAVHPLKSGTRSAAFGPWVHPITGDQTIHHGVDWKAPLGTKVVAPRDGWVTAAEDQGAAGLTVVLRHPGGIETRYHHLARYSVQAGDPVVTGATLGEVGSTGKSTGPHLHFEVRDLGVAVDPEAYLDTQQ